MKTITFDEFKTSVYNAIENRLKIHRRGQAAFNFIHYKYKVARDVQFDEVHPVDCFYDDTKIDEFIEEAWKKYKKWYLKK